MRFLYFILPTDHSIHNWVKGRISKRVLQKKTKHAKLFEKRTFLSPRYAHVGTCELKRKRFCRIFFQIHQQQLNSYPSSLHYKLLNFKSKKKHDSIVIEMKNPKIFSYVRRNKLTPLFLIGTGLLRLITRFFLLSNKNLRTLHQGDEPNYRQYGGTKTAPI